MENARKFQVHSGLTAETLAPLIGKRVGLVTNQTGISPDFEPTDTTLSRSSVIVAALFGPEHGYYGVDQAGVAVASDDNATPEVDQVRPVYSLYRLDKDQPEKVSYGLPVGSLDNLAALVFDIQDVGTRYYTYPSTLGILLEQADIPVYVVDRPNPLGGVAVEGPFVEAGFNSFVGRYEQIPVQHGLTIGELARYINRFHLAERANLVVLPMKNWTRSMTWESTGWPWLATSPNLPTLKTARLYPGTCLLEGTNLSVGRGTTQPFELIGAPWIDRPDQLAEILNRLNRPGLYFRPTYFKPGAAPYSAEICGGVQVHITELTDLHQVVRSGLYLVNTLARFYPSHFEWRVAHFDRLIGSDRPRMTISNQANLTELFQSWDAQESAFQQQRKAIMLYP